QPAATSERWFSRNNAHDLDLDRSYFALKTEILSVDLGDLLSQVALNGVQLGFRTHFQSEFGQDLAAVLAHLGAGRCNAPQLFAAGLDQALEGAPGNQQASLVICGQHHGVGTAEQVEHQQERHETADQ